MIEYDVAPAPELASASAPAPEDVRDVGGAGGIPPEAIRAAALRNTAVYASLYLRGPRRAPYNGRFLVNWHHREWAEIEQKHKRACILAARGSGKSWFWVFASSLREAERSPGCEIAIFSNSQPQARKRLRTIRLEIEGNPKLQHLLPSRKQRSLWGTDAICLANGTLISTAGFGTKARGDHPKRLVVDDGLSDENMTSAGVRKHHIEHFYSAIESMPDENDPLYVVGTPMHVHDLYGDLRRRGEYFFRAYPAVDRDGKLLWAAKLPRAALEAKRRRIGEIRFAREFLVKPLSDASSLFPSWMFEGPAERVDAVLGMPREAFETLGVRRFYIGVDFGLAATIGSDYTVVFGWGVDGDGNRWVLDIDRERGVGYEAQKDKIRRMGQKYRADLIYAEGVQAQRIFGETLAMETDLPVKPFFTGRGKHSDAIGVPGMRVLFENKKVRIPRGDGRSVELTDIWAGEMQAMTVQDGRVVSIADHDDAAMACWMAECAVRDSGQFDFTFSERPGDREALEAQEAEDALLDEAGLTAPDTPEEDLFGIVAATEHERMRDEQARADARREEQKALSGSGAVMARGGLLRAPPPSWFLGGGLGF